jgi:hypothetical protein
MKLFKETTAAFKISDLGLLHHYLGIEVKEGASGISLSQGAYAVKILRSGTVGSNPCHVPMETHLKLSKFGTQLLVNATEYKSIVKSLRYLANTLPNLAFVVCYESICGA